MTKNNLYRVLCGFLLGVSILAPGLSGSVVAILMGVYLQLIKIASNPLKDFKNNFFFLLPMAIGAVVSILLFVKILGFLFDDYEIQARMLFFGLVVGSLPDLWKQVQGVSLKGKNGVALGFAFALAAVFGIMTRVGTVSFAAEPSIVYLCVVGFVAGVTAIIPGLSVSVILMMFGMYTYLMSAASSYTNDLSGAVLTLLPVGIFFIVGLILFSKVVKMLFQKYDSIAYTMVFGFMCGTLISVFPESAPGTVLGWIGSAVMFVVGFIAALSFVIMGKKLNTD